MNNMFRQWFLYIIILPRVSVCPPADTSTNLNTDLIKTNGTLAIEDPYGLHEVELSQWQPSCTESENRSNLPLTKCGFLNLPHNYLYRIL